MSVAALLTARDPGATCRQRTAARREESRMTGQVPVVRAGALTTVQDAAGPATPTSACRVPERWTRPRCGSPTGSGQRPDAAVLETTLTGCAVCVPHRGVTVVVGGAPCPVTVDGRPAAWGAPVRVPGGRGAGRGGGRHGGALATWPSPAASPPKPCSAAAPTDLLSGLGPRRSRDGDGAAPGGLHGPPDGADAVPHPGPVRRELCCRYCRARAPTGSPPGGPAHPHRRPLTGSRPQQPHRPAHGGAAAGTRQRPANCPAREWFWAPSRSRRTAAP